MKSLGSLESGAQVPIFRCSLDQASRRMFSGSRRRFPDGSDHGTQTGPPLTTGRLLSTAPFCQLSSCLHFLSGSPGVHTPTLGAAVGCGTGLSPIPLLYP